VLCAILKRVRADYNGVLLVVLATVKALH